MTTSLFRAAADVVVGLHVAFVVFVVLGGWLALRWRRVAWIHVPAALWGVTVEWGGWICPLTPLENYLRERSGSIAFRGDFIEHYLVPLLYPPHLTRTMQIAFGTVALALNLIVYWRLARSGVTRLRKGHRNRSGPGDAKG